VDGRMDWLISGWMDGLIYLILFQFKFRISLLINPKASLELLQEKPPGQLAFQV